jgi:hypothetical protein
MNKCIIAHFINNEGEPATGLSPSITVRDLSDDSIIVNSVMSEIGGGGYRYVITDYDVSKAYQVVCDAITIDNRYSFGVNVSSYYSGVHVVSAFFVDNDGIAATGLTPTIRIYNALDGSIVVSDVAMDEVGDGGYKYFFTAFNPNNDYFIRCDAGESIQARYSFGVNEEYITETMAMPISGETESMVSLEGRMINKTLISGEMRVI